MYHPDIFMQPKKKRQETILEILEREPVGTQQELTRRLRRRGFFVDQPTISRDLRELELVKVRDDGPPHRQGRWGGGRAYRYVRREELSEKVGGNGDGVLDLVRGLVKKALPSGNLLVLRTDPGNAARLGVALDRLRLPEILGNVAGDDTVIAVCREGLRSSRVARLLAGRGG